MSNAMSKMPRRDYGLKSFRRNGCLLLLSAGMMEAQQPAATFRANTELVQVNVIAHDKQGRPVANLRREEFQLFDNGMRQELRLFIPETVTDGPASPATKTAGTFTNQISALGGSHSGYSVILIDDLFSGSDPTNEEGSTLSRARVLQMLRSIPVDEKIAIYALGPRKLQVVAEFTSDRDLLEQQLRKWKPTPTTPAPDPRNSLQAQLNPQMAPTRGDAAKEFTRIEDLHKATIGDSEMDLMADHLTGIPGRKNLIWLANKFPIGPRTLQNLNRAGVSIYPVDIDGVCRLCPDRPKQQMENIAAFTGGIAYYGRNDLATALREAIDDGRVSYTLGFYPSGEDTDTPRAHRLAVKIDRPGVELRYSTVYQPRSVSTESSSARVDLMKTLDRPMDATAIPIKAHVTRVQDRLNLEATLDAASLDLVRDQDLWTGKIEVVARFITADGVFASDAFSQTLILNLNQDSYDLALRGGLTYHNEFRIPPTAVELKLMFANTAAGKIGTLTIWLAQVTGVVANAK
jgi:VWFA-related protein